MKSLDNQGNQGNLAIYVFLTVQAWPIPEIFLSFMNISHLPVRKTKDKEDIVIMGVNLLDIYEMSLIALFFKVIPKRDNLMILLDTSSYPLNTTTHAVGWLGLNSFNGML